MRTVKTTDTISIIKFIAIVIIINYVLHFIVVVVNRCVAFFQLHLIHIIGQGIYILLSTIENVIVHCIRTIFIFFNLTDNHPFSRFLLNRFFNHLFFHNNWWRNVAWVKVNVVSVTTGNISPSAACTCEKCYQCN